MNVVENASSQRAPAGGAHAGPHVLPPSVLLGTAAALGVLTVLTVAVARVHLGAANVPVALAIATVKASLVALFFMHLKYEHRFHLVVLVGAALFAVLFGSFVMFDASEYRPDVRAHEEAVRAKAAQAAP
jgi:cytochrome c oxidase subunit 4